MTKNIGFKFLVGAGFGAVLLIVLNIIVLKQARVVYTPGQDIRTSLFSTAISFNELFGYIGRWKELAKENEKLRAKINENVIKSAQLEALMQVNDSLRRAVGLGSRLERVVTPAGLFNLNLMPDGYNALINKGSEDGIIKGNIVLTSEGFLAGRIEEIFSNTSRVMLVSDPSFKTTVRVQGRETSGIARGALADGMVLDLVVQTDHVVEGDILVSTGDDTIPAGLVVGTITNVQNNETEIFQKVKIAPAMRFTSGTVMIIHE